jgi:ribonuclease E
MERQYKIQEVIKRRQIMLVQVVKEERGNKGAALTTYLSLAGRYSVLMPNTARGGGISRKITNAAGPQAPEGIVPISKCRRAWASSCAPPAPPHQGRDQARLRISDAPVGKRPRPDAALDRPCLVYEEGSLIKRSIRDLYNKDIDEVLVAGEDGYREAKDFMRMLMPSHAKAVQPIATQPLFSRYGIEASSTRCSRRRCTLKSGGYIVINQTEALVSIDVNSGRSTASTTSRTRRSRPTSKRPKKSRASCACATSPA